MHLCFEVAIGAIISANDEVGMSLIIRIIIQSNREAVY